MTTVDKKPPVGATDNDFKKGTQGPIGCCCCFDASRTTRGELDVTGAMITYY